MRNLFANPAHILLMQEVDNEMGLMLRSGNWLGLDVRYLGGPPRTMRTPQVGRTRIRTYVHTYVTLHSLSMISCLVRVFLCFM